MLFTVIMTALNYANDRYSNMADRLYASEWYQPAFDLQKYVDNLYLNFRYRQWYSHILYDTRSIDIESMKKVY